MKKHPERAEGLSVADLRLIEKRIEEQKRHAFKRFPLLFAILVTFGTAITFNGIGRLIAKIPALYDHPIITILVGLLILLFTGALYKKI